VITTNDEEFHLKYHFKQENEIQATPFFHRKSLFEMSKTQKNNTDQNIPLLENLRIYCKKLIEYTGTQLENGNISVTSPLNLGILLDIVYQILSGSCHVSRDLGKSQIHQKTFRHYPTIWRSLTEPTGIMVRYPALKG
jgi:hypothetical protein